MLHSLFSQEKKEQKMNRKRTLTTLFHFYLGVLQFCRPRFSSFAQRKQSQQQNNYKKELSNETIHLHDVDIRSVRYRSIFPGEN